jgi:phenylacetate-CoA ligase
VKNFYRMEPRAQREQVFRNLLKYIREVVYPYHPAFRKMCQEFDVDPRRFRTYEDFQQLPVVTKSDYRAAPLSYVLQPTFPGKTPLYPTSPINRKYLVKYLAQAALNYPRVKTGLFRRETLREKVEQRAIREWFPIHTHVSSGSTGEPTPVLYTHRDLTEILPELAASQMAQVLRTDVPAFRYDNRRMNIFPGAPHLAFFQSVFIKTTLGLNMFDTFGGKVIPTDRQIEIFANGGFHSLAAVPSYLVHWLRRAVELREAGKVKPFGENFVMAVLGGEPVSEPMRKYIHELAARMGAHPQFRILETLGSTELRWAGSECFEGSGIHLNPKYYFCEVLDPVTRKPVADGEPGVLTFSHVGWRGTVFTRYWSGDLVQGGGTWDRCPSCGYTFFRVRGPIARADKDFTKIKGVQVALQQLVGAVRDSAGVRNCQVILEKDARDGAFGRDLVTVRVLPEPGADRDAVAAAVRESVRTATELSPDRIVFEADAPAFEAELFSRTGIKADFLVDRRDPGAAAVGAAARAERAALAEPGTEAGKPGLAEAAK